MLTQQEAEALMAFPKRFVDPSPIDFPGPGDFLTRGLVSVDGRESFVLDVNRAGRIRVTKCTYQERYASTVVLVRLDVGGPPHTNPDRTEVPCPHLHVYREGYETRWAKAVPGDVFRDTSDLCETLRDFLQLCNVEDVPHIQGVLI